MVYFIRNEASGAIKIGFAIYPSHRFKQLQTATPDRLTLIGAVAGGKAYEAELHRRFRRFHLNREWFQGTDEVVDFVQKTLASLAVPEIVRGRTVWDECKRRNNCRHGLPGVGVRLIGDTAGTAARVIHHTFWGGKDRLILSLYDGEQVPADEAILVDDWPVVCCEPEPLTVGKVLKIKRP